MSRHFLIRLPLTTPVILTHRTTLDAILAAQLFDETQDLDYATTRIPLEREHGIWCGSAVFLEKPVLVDEIVVGSSVRALSLDPALIRPKGTGRYVAIDPRGGDFRNRQSFMHAHATPAAYFMGRGDLDEVRRLMRTMTGMGKRRNSGYGQIDMAAAEFRLLDYPRAQGTLMLTDGTPSRPVPVDIWTQLKSLAPVLRAEVRFEPPYNLTEAVDCVLPTHQNIDADRVNSLLM